MSGNILQIVADFCECPLLNASVKMYRMYCDTSLHHFVCLYIAKVVTLYKPTKSVLDLFT